MSFRYALPLTRAHVRLCSNCCFLFSLLAATVSARQALSVLFMYCQLSCFM